MEKYIVLGGFFSGNRVNTVEVYDIRTGSWTTVSGMPTAKNVFASEIYGGKIYTVGGYNAGSLDKVEVYDIEVDVWSSGPSMIGGRAELETAREGDKIYAIGGLNTAWLKTSLVEVLTLNDLTVSSSLPYDINAYLESEMQNSDKTKTMDKSILNIKANSETLYNTFIDTVSPVLLLSNQMSGNDVTHGIDFKLKGNIAHEKDVYKTTIKFEARQR